jgi:hypothetical protein
MDRDLFRTLRKTAQRFPFDRFMQMTIIGHASVCAIATSHPRGRQPGRIAVTRMNFIHHTTRFQSHPGIRGKRFVAHRQLKFIGGLKL